MQFARRDYLGGRRPADRSGPIHDALQVRNQGFYRAIDLVAWHARASFARGDALREFSELVDLLQSLSQLDLLLAAAVGEPAENGPSESADRLETRKNRVQAQMSALESSLRSQAALAVKDAEKEPITRGVARPIEDLLTVPLLDAGSRMALVESLDRTGKWPPESQLASAAADRASATVIGSQQVAAARQSGLKAPWRARSNKRSSSRFWWPWPIPKSPKGLPNRFLPRPTRSAAAAGSCGNSANNWPPTIANCRAGSSKPTTRPF